VFFHYKGLQFEASPERPDPVFAMKLQELIGGHWGEMTVAMQYLFQGWNCRIPGKYKDLLLDVGTEELAHVEMLATMVAKLLEGAPAEATARGKQLFRELDLDGLWERQPKSMSGGQRRRLDIAVGLVHVPGLVFLDEPTTGLDPQARANLWQHIRGLREERGTTVFLTTHYLDEADALCDRILVIDHGAIVASGTPDELKSQVGGDVLTVTVQRPDQVAEVARLVGLTAGHATTADDPDGELLCDADLAILASARRSLCSTTEIRPSRSSRRLSASRS